MWRFPFALPKNTTALRRVCLCSGGQAAAQAVLAGERLRGASVPVLRFCGRPVAETGRPTGAGGRERRAAGQACSLVKGQVSSRRRLPLPRRVRTKAFLCVCSVHIFFFLNPVILQEALGFLFSSLGERPPEASWAAVLGAVGSQWLFPLRSVLSHLSQLGCQVGGGMFLYKASYVTLVVQVVEADRLPLLGLCLNRLGTRGRL